MRLYILSISAGYVQLFLLLTLLGVTTGFVNAWPYLAIIASLGLGIVVPILALFYDRIAAVVASMAGLVSLGWVVASLVSSEASQPSWDVLLLVPPALVLIDSLTRLVLTRDTTWLALRPTPSLALRTVLAVFPTLLIAASFNIPLVLQVLFQGMPSTQ